MFTSVLFCSCEISRSYHTFFLPNHSLFTNSSGLTFSPAASDAQLPPVNSFSKPTISSLRFAQRTLDKKVCKMILIKTHLVIIIFRKYCLFKWTTFPRCAFLFLPLLRSLSLLIFSQFIHLWAFHARAIWNELHSLISYSFPTLFLVCLRDLHSVLPFSPQISLALHLSSLACSFTLTQIHSLFGSRDLLTARSKRYQDPANGKPAATIAANGRVFRDTVPRFPVFVCLLCCGREVPLPVVTSRSQ